MRQMRKIASELTEDYHPQEIPFKGLLAFRNVLIRSFLHFEIQIFGK